MKADLSNYSWALDHILKLNLEKHIKVVAEVGSRDAMDAIYLQKRLSCDVFVFEPDPFNSIICQENILNYEFNSHLYFNQLALSNENGLIDFYSIDKTKYENVGSSGMYQINFRRRPRLDPDKNRDSVQNRVRVNASRFDSLKIPTPDLLAMDVERSEIKVLKGFGVLIKQVQFIVLETSFWNNFQNHRDVSTFPKISRYLEKNNFQFIASNHEGNLHFPKRSKRRTVLYQHQPNFDVLYCNKDLL